MALGHDITTMNFADRAVGDDDGPLLFGPSTEWSLVMKDDPGWNFDEAQHNHPSQYVAPPEIEELRIAAASGDFVAVQRTFTAQWLNKPAADRFDKDLFATSLVEAIQRDDAVVASYLLLNCITMNVSHFVMATELRKYSILQLFLEIGWDINRPIEDSKPAPLS